MSAKVLKSALECSLELKHFGMVAAIWYICVLIPRRVLMMSVALSKRKCSCEHLFYTNKAVKTSTVLHMVL